jgi:hypothetical protein
MSSYRKLVDLGQPERLKEVREYNRDYELNRIINPEHYCKYQAFSINPAMFNELKAKQKFNDYDLSTVNDIVKQFRPKPDDIKKILEASSNITKEQVITEKFTLTRETNARVRYLCDEIILRNIQIGTLSDELKNEKSGRALYESEIARVTKELNRRKGQKEKIDEKVAEKKETSANKEKKTKDSEGSQLEKKDNKPKSTDLLFSTDDINVLKANQTKQLEIWEKKCKALENELERRKDFDMLLESYVASVQMDEKYRSKTRELNKLLEVKDSELVKAKEVILLKENEKMELVKSNNILNSTMKNLNDELIKSEINLIDLKKRLQEQGEEKLNRVLELSKLKEMIALRENENMELAKSNNILHDTVKSLSHEFDQSKLNLAELKLLFKKNEEEFDRVLKENKNKKMPEKKDQVTETLDLVKEKDTVHYGEVDLKLVYLMETLNELKDQASSYFKDQGFHRKKFTKAIFSLKKMLNLRMSSKRINKGVKESNKVSTNKLIKQEPILKSTDDVEKYLSSEDENRVLEECMELRQVVRELRDHLKVDFVKETSKLLTETLKEQLKLIAKENSLNLQNQAKTTFNSLTTKISSRIKEIEPSKTFSIPSSNATQQPKNVDTSSSRPSKVSERQNTMVLERLNILSKLPITYENNMIETLNQEDREIFAFHFVLTDTERSKLGKWWIHSCYLDHRHMMRSLEFAMTKWVVCSRGA